MNEAKAKDYPGIQSKAKSIKAKERWSLSHFLGS